MASPSRNGNVEASAEAIRRYLQAHPHASDTVDGVLRWWLAPQEFTLPTERVREALERLVAEGIAVRRTLPDGTVIYAAAQRRPPGGTVSN
jgi:phosphatidylserine/phosphatidylglycerophosphate/cardiolipin synthase-like enzyme